LANPYYHLRSKVFLCVFIFTLSSLACGVQTKLPAVAIDTQIATQISTAVNPTATQETARIVGSWNVREFPGESSTLVVTLTNADVQVISCKPYEGGEWCFVHFDGGRGWINRRGIE